MMSFIPALLAPANLSPPISARNKKPNAFSRCVMLTSTTSWFAARFAPSYGIMPGDPVA